MIGHISLAEKVDADFSHALRKALLRRVGARLRRDTASNRLLCFNEVRKIHGAAMRRVYRGIRVVPVGQIGGSVGRCSEFDRDFMPAKSSAEERWKLIDRAFHRDEGLPPVSLYKVGGSYFVLDGHHRLSVARYHGVEWIDAYVTEFRAGVWSERRVKDGLTKPSQGGESRMRQMMDLQFVNQAREEMLREAESSRQAKALRAARKRRAGRRSTLVWEMKRYAGGFLKLLRTLKNAG